MKLKQTVSPLSLFALMVSSAICLLVPGVASAAIVCPQGEEYHASDGSCWIKDTQAPVSQLNGNGLSCARKDHDLVGNECVKYTRTNSQPKSDDNKPLTYSCGPGQEYHASDNSCWTKETRPQVQSPGSNAMGCPGGYEKEGTQCVKYTRAGNPTVATSSTPAAATQAEQICGVVSSMSNARSAEAITNCQAAVNQCIQSNPNNSQAQAACASQVSGAPQNRAQQTLNPQGGGGGSTQGDVGNCGQVRTNLIPCSNNHGVQAFGDLLKMIIFILSILVGVVAVGGIVYGATLYASARDNAGQTQKALEIIRNVVIGLLAYGFMVVIINWLVPGAVIG